MTKTGFITFIIIISLYYATLLTFNRCCCCLLVPISIALHPSPSHTAKVECYAWGASWRIIHFSDFSTLRLIKYITTWPTIRRRRVPWQIVDHLLLLLVVHGHLTRLSSSYRLGWLYSFRPTYMCIVILRTRTKRKHAREFPLCSLVLKDISFSSLYTQIILFLVFLPGPSLLSSCR